METRCVPEVRQAVLIQTASTDSSLTALLAPSTISTSRRCGEPQQPSGSCAQNEVGEPAANTGALRQGAEKHACEFDGCEYRTTRCDNLARHTRNRHAPPEHRAVHRCPECGATFSYSSNVARHRKQFHLARHAREHRWEQACGTAPGGLGIRVRAGYDRKRSANPLRAAKRDKRTQPTLETGQDSMGVTGGCGCVAEVEQRLQCKVCLDAELASVLVPCGHSLACWSCAGKLKTCPLCRAPITARTRIYI
mmetsp:Transcript_1752/g.3776  ORF Transcript_1752/g.3776 Transcript_1752/m.3776 type:complete len:251 (+) Transcript_1752:427-1179(+)